MSSGHAIKRGTRLANQVLNFLQASASHIYHGLPTASDEIVDERWLVCESNACGCFVSQGDGEGECRHNRCGCRVASAAVRSPRPNKLRWLDQKCPADLWPITEREASDGN